ncbi:ectoine hydroxylase [Streptomyces sp. NBC_00075]|uniref:ectoine hydroxylase n=1 Tax=Streptomyces sp. NBC_00075 TaxID=2975641 RepID=UPI0032470626
MGGANPADRYPTRLAVAAESPRREPVVWTKWGSGPLDSDALAAYDRDGFLVFGDLFNDDEVERYRAEADRLCTDAAMLADERAVVEPTGGELRSIFEVHAVSPVFADLAADPRLLERARQILGSEVYIHQSRINLKPGFGAAGFYWHSDFETWHAEDGMPAPRALSFSIALTNNLEVNGPLMIIPGSHRTFVGCEGETPPEHFRSSLRRQEIGTPSASALAGLAERFGISQVTGRAGAATVFDSNCMHGSSDNITPYPRRNVFIVYNSMENSLVEPFCSAARRPEFIASRDFTPVRARRHAAAHD